MTEGRRQQGVEAFQSKERKNKVRRNERHGEYP
jgi:hypothetical protein